MNTASDPRPSTPLTELRPRVRKLGPPRHRTRVTRRRQPGGVRGSRKPPSGPKGAAGVLGPASAALPLIEDERAVALECRAFADAEHRDLEPVVERITALGALTDVWAIGDLAQELRSLLTEMEARWTPHSEWEDAFCYARLDALAETPWATRALREQHRQIRDRLEVLNHIQQAALRAPDPTVRTGVRAELYGLHALLITHLEQENRALSLLDGALGS